MKQQPQKTLTPKQISDYQAMNEEFIKEGTEFEEANILHYKMKLKRNLETLEVQL